MEPRKLTEKQRAVYQFIKGYIETMECAPYIREIQESCKISSYKGTVDRLLALEKKGYIKRELSKHRSISLVQEQ